MIAGHLKNGPVQRLLADRGLAVDADRVPARRALPEDVDRVRLRVDDLADPDPDLPQEVFLDGAYEDTTLHAVAVSLQHRGHPCPAAVLADVVGDDMGQRHDSPVQD